MQIRTARKWYAGFPHEGKIFHSHAASLHTDDTNPEKVLAGFRAEPSYSQGQSPGQRIYRFLANNPLFAGFGILIAHQRIRQSAIFMGLRAISVQVHGFTADKHLTGRL